MDETGPLFQIGDIVTFRDGLQHDARWNPRFKRDYLEKNYAFRSFVVTERNPYIVEDVDTGERLTWTLCGYELIFADEKNLKELEVADEYSLLSFFARARTNEIIK